MFSSSISMEVWFVCYQCMKDGNEQNGKEEMFFLTGIFGS